MFLQHAAILPCKIIKRSEFDYAYFYYMMAMGGESYRLRFAVIGFSPIPKINAISDAG